MTGSFFIRDRDVHVGVSVGLALFPRDGEHRVPGRLDEGRIVETGTHAALIANPHGLYKKLYDLQFRV